MAFNIGAPLRDRIFGQKLDLLACAECDSHFLGFFVCSAFVPGPMLLVSLCLAAMLLMICSVDAEEAFSIVVVQVWTFILAMLAIDGVFELLGAAILIVLE